MSCLLDTHTFLWLVSNGPLSEVAREWILDVDNSLWLSAASYWEICIKTSLGKLELGPDWSNQFEAVIEQNSLHWLPIDKEASRQLISLPQHHRDPFDRMLVAQALVGGHKLISADSALRAYDVEVIW